MDPFYFLIQWEDRFVSVIAKQQIVSPLKNQLEYQEGDIIRATYGKKTFEAVICDIHPNKKYLLAQAKLPPKWTYIEAKRQKSGTSPSLMMPTPPLMMPSLSLNYGNPPPTPSVEPYNRYSNTTRTPTVEPYKRYSNTTRTPVEPFSNTTRTPTVEPFSNTTRTSTVEPTVEPFSNTTRTPTVEPNSKTTRKPTPFVEISLKTPLKHTSSTSTSESLESPKQKESGWEDECRSPRRKIRKLEERIVDLEAKRPNKSNEDMALQKVSHLTDSQDVVAALTSSIFTNDELIKCSRTGKKTIKCVGSPRPPLEQAKVQKLERLVIMKTGMTKADFINKFSNLQKVLRRKAGPSSTCATPKD